MFGKIFGKILPLREKRMAEQAAEENDLRERQIIAQEMIGKQMAITNQNLAVLNEKFFALNGSQQTLMAALTSANQSLAVLIDRSQRRREEYDDNR